MWNWRARFSRQIKQQHKEKKNNEEKEIQREWENKNRPFGFPTYSRLIKLYWQLFWHKFRILYMSPSSVANGCVLKRKEKVNAFFYYCILYTSRHKKTTTEASKCHRKTDRDRKISDNNCHKIRVLAQYEQRVCVSTPIFMLNGDLKCIYMYISKFISCNVEFIYMCVVLYILLLLLLRVLVCAYK